MNTKNGKKTAQGTGGEHGERLGTLAQHLQAGQVGAEGVALGKGVKQGIEVHRIVFEQPRCPRCQDSW